MSTMWSSHEITFHEALHRFPHWSEADRELAAYEAGRLRADGFRLQNSGQSVTLLREGVTVAWFGAGQISYVNGELAHKQAWSREWRAPNKTYPDMHTLALSRYGGGAPRPEVANG